MAINELLESIVTGEGLPIPTIIGFVVGILIICVGFYFGIVKKDRNSFLILCLSGVFTVFLNGIGLYLASRGMNIVPTNIVNIEGTIEGIGGTIEGTIGGNTQIGNMLSILVGSIVIVLGLLFRKKQWAKYAILIGISPVITSVLWLLLNL